VTWQRLHRMTPTRWSLVEPCNRQTDRRTLCTSVTTVCISCIRRSLRSSYMEDKRCSREKISCTTIFAARTVWANDYTDHTEDKHRRLQTTPIQQFIRLPLWRPSRLSSESSKAITWADRLQNNKKQFKLKFTDTKQPPLMSTTKANIGAICALIVPS